MKRRIAVPDRSRRVGLRLGRVGRAGGSAEPAGMERMQHWAADHEALLDANLAGMKAGLKLTPDQEKLWGPFETVVRDAAKTRMENDAEKCRDGDA